MRFVENGPWIPDELLNARDEGRVVFFCGSGVSRAKVGLPDFFGLANNVVRELHVSEDSDALKVLDAAQKIGKELSVSGLISADRIFALLEREFGVADIQAAVAKSLDPKENPDLSAHQILLRLATTPDSKKTQLVTTNFDTLFHQCSPDLRCYQPPRLPDLSRYDDLDGVVYLHGRVNSDYTAADGDGFVLSSSDFGYAYLSEGWATEFFREIIRKYVVLFVGYSADDPPIHYLLEGLRQTKDLSCEIYAFQAEESDEAVARWQDKEVKAIPYDQANGHAALWDTLEHWADRADNPSAWRSKNIDIAMNGPEELLPHQRGQVAHIVSTVEGAREFARREPPAEWLCVFDPLCRYAGSGRLNRSDSESPRVTPFSLYGLDSDKVPERSESTDQFATRDIPAGAWDAFAATIMDRQNLTDENFPALRGHYATNIPRLPKRLTWLGAWIANVANQPAAVWWAARQKPLHPNVRDHIESEMDRHHDQFGSVVRKAWRYLLEAWNTFRGEPLRGWHDLKSEIDREGWTPGTVRRFGTFMRPYLKAGPGIMSMPEPPKEGTGLQLPALLRLEVRCPVPPFDADIPDESLGLVVCELRRNIELAVQLSKEVDDMRQFRISPIIPDERPDISDYERTRGLSGCVIYFASLFERLIKLDLSEARREFLLWPANDEVAFCRLRLWAAGNADLATPDEFYQIVTELSDEVFWGSHHRRDFLIVLAKRWSMLSNKCRMQIENRLLKGPPQYTKENDAEYAERKAWITVHYLQWFLNNGCDFSFNVKEEISQRRPSAPNWKPEYAKHAADSMEGRGGWVATITEHSALLREPISSVLSKARELSGQSETNTLEEHDPFAGLCAARPVRAMCVLSHAARKNEYPQWAWETFLDSTSHEKSKPKFSALVVERLCQMPDEALGKLLYSATSWLQKIAKVLSKQCPVSFDKATSRLIDVLSQMPVKGHSAIISSSHGRDRVTEALNSPAGHIVRAILEDSRLETLHNEVDSSQNWLSLLERLLMVSGDPRQHAIAMMSLHLEWFHCVASEWTERHLLLIIDSADMEDQEFLWDGFLWHPRVNPKENSSLYLRLKPALLAIVREKKLSTREGHIEALASFTLSGWLTLSPQDEERLVSNDEFRDLLLHGGDDFRSHVLWQIGRELEDADQEHCMEVCTQALELFQDVWPRQRAVKNSVTSARLCELLSLNNEAFPKLVDAVLPLMTRISQGSHLFYGDKTKAIIKNYPERFLEVLHTVLPEDVSEWPYRIGEKLEAIAEADNSLRSDPRLVELNRKWAAR